MIVTFYSYKGGVGRSMALANIADQLARSGMRVLMVDFDLEAPGLEHFFPIDQDRVRDREGLLDLLLAYKYAMSMASSEPVDGTDGEEDAFRDLDRYLSTVYPPRSDGGRLDLLAAGRRLTDDQINRYGAELRRFDWQDFYFVWSGELFFEWFRRTCAERYDIVLVDSRTGVTELGGVCAYQLADTVVTLCAPNLQNLDGTAWMVRHFLSPQVRRVRGDRPLEVLVVPARVDQQDTALLDSFAARFHHAFDAYTPDPLPAAGLRFWDLQIPYEPAYAFDEQVITDPSRAAERRGLARAYASLRSAITLLAPGTSPLAELRPPPADHRPASPSEPTETRYDPTTRFSTPDVLISYRAADREAADRLRGLLTHRGGLHVVEHFPGRSRSRDEGVRARLCLVLVGASKRLGLWQLREIEALAVRGDAAILPVLLPGATRPPDELADHQALDLRMGWNDPLLVDTVRAALRDEGGDRRTPSEEIRTPYPGRAAFSTADADLFFGREPVLDRVLATLREFRMCTIVGDSGSGKTSLVNAGVIPALRAGGLSGSHLWPVLIQASMADAQDLPDRLRALSREQGQPVVAVMDHFEDLFLSVPPDQRHVLLSSLRSLTEDSSILPIAVVRSDSLADVRRDAHSFAVCTVEVPPLTEEELWQAVELPARARGLQLEPGLTDRLLKDIGEGAGPLPLLQTALDRLWLHREDGYLTHQAYAGGIGASLTDTAEELFQRLSAEDSDRARALLLQLVALDTDGRPLAPAVPKSIADELDAADLCDKLIRRRLLVSLAQDDERPCLRLAHPALMTDWPRLATWIAQSSEALRLRPRLWAAARAWEADPDDRRGVLNERSLSAVRTALEPAPFPLSAAETAYLAESRAEAKRRRTGWRIAVFSLAFAMISGCVLIVFAFWGNASPVNMGTVGTTALANLLSALTLIRSLRDERRTLIPDP
ncbi:AAA family ATPase [Streptomyces sp. NPDC093252]|uniref:nSTAND1 domain-containing NTPase n=1 Tax=Streptomyces sp. NPDC093252 TaxID=3154980 RepID=UPI0034430656